MFLKKKKRCCILWRCGVDGWVRAVVDSTYGWLDGCVRTERVSSNGGVGRKQREQKGKHKGM